MAGSPSISTLFAQRVIIGVGDMAVSNNVHVVLSTYALGSCVGVIAYDPLSKVGGILHIMLPDSSISPEKAARQPAMFADTGLPRFFSSFLGLRGEHRRLRAFVAGGASVIAGQDPFRIGERNSRVTMDYLQQQGCQVRFTDIGGAINRTVHLEMATGTVTLKRPSDTQQLSLAE